MNQPQWPYDGTILLKVREMNALLEKEEQLLAALAPVRASIEEKRAELRHLIPPFLAKAAVVLEAVTDAAPVADPDGGRAIHIRDEGGEALDNGTGQQHP